MTPRTRQLKWPVNKDDLGAPYAEVACNGAGNPIDLTGYTVTFGSFATNSTGGTPVISETATGIATQPTKSVTYDSTTGKFMAYEHGLRYQMEIVFATTGTIFTGITAGRRYFVRNDVTPHYFSVANEPEGTAVEVSGGSSCTFYVIGHVVYVSQSGDFATTGNQYGWFFLEAPDGAKRTWPKSEYHNQGGGIEIVVQ